MSEEAPLTMSVPAAGKKYFGLSRNGAYDAAARGDLPTIRIGRLLRVPVRPSNECWIAPASGQRDPSHSHQSIEPVPGKENAGPRWRAYPART